MSLIIKKTAAEFTAENPLLTESQVGIESDTGLAKSGYGNWNDLDYTVPGKDSFEQILSGDVNKVPSSKAVKDYIDSLLASS